MILDHVDTLEISKETAERRRNEIIFLNRLGTGLGHLYCQVRGIEQKIESFTGDEVRVFTFGRTPGVARGADYLVSCMHEWYAVSACSFIRTVGWLASQDDPTLAQPGDYVKTVIPDVLLWRNKVAAHPAQMSPRNDDNPATLDASVMYSLTWDDTRYRIGNMSLLKTSGGQQHKSALKPWSLTETHEALVPRYWPKALHTAADDKGKSA